MINKSSCFDKDKLVTTIESLVHDHLAERIWESSGIIVGLIKGNAVKVIITREVDEVEEAIETLKEHPEFNCLLKS